MERYNEIISESLIDFEEIKFILANNNIELTSSLEIKQRYFLKKDVSFKKANISKIIENSYILENIEHKLYLSYKTIDKNHIIKSKIEIIDEDMCIEFLNHAGFEKAFTIEKNVYVYQNAKSKISVVNLIGIGLYLNVRKENASEEELKLILSSFGLPYKENKCDVNFERLAINKARRYLR